MPIGPPLFSFRQAARGTSKKRQPDLSVSAADISETVLGREAADGLGEAAAWADLMNTCLARTRGKLLPSFLPSV